MNVLAAFKKVKLFALDVDGVLTDSTIYLVGNGIQARRMNIKDGYALQLAVKKGYTVVVISGAVSEEVKERLQKLGIKHVYMGVKDKLALLQSLIASQNIDKDEILFAGDDMPDLAVMQWCGLACCPADGVAQIKDISHYISKVRGGEGFVRELIEKTLTLNGDWNEDAEIASV